MNEQEKNCGIMLNLDTQIASIEGAAAQLGAMQAMQSGAVAMSAMSRLAYLFSIFF